jgi:hypothetical protein
LFSQATPVATSSSCKFASELIPGCAPSALAGSAFARRVASLAEHDRDDAIRRELLAGNLPAFLHSAVPVDLVGRALDGALTRITLCVLPDYLSIGSDTDYVLMPMSLHAALAGEDVRLHAADKQENTLAAAGRTEGHENSNRARPAAHRTTFLRSTESFLT